MNRTLDITTAQPVNIVPIGGEFAVNTDKYAAQWSEIPQREEENGIEIKDLKLSFGSFALKGINLNVPKGTVMGLVGRNGAGKTTLIKCIADCCKYSGTVLVNGISADNDKTEYFTRLGVVFDSIMFNENIKVKNFADSYIKIFPDFDEDFYNKYLDIFRINRRVKISKLSFGMKKKFQLVAAMSLKPPVLVLDEPTTGVDPSDRTEILNMLLDYMQDEEHTVLLSTHITSDLDKIADYVAMLEDGRLIFTESKDLLQDKYRLIRAGHGVLSLTDRRLIGAKIDAFGIEALTDSHAIWNMPGVTAVVPTVEQIMLSFLESNNKEEV